MNKWIIVLCFIGFSKIVSAHQADVSSTMLVETAPNTWVLQIRAALTAFEYEVKTNFPDSDFKSAEEFQDLVSKYVESSLSITFNGDTEVTFHNPKVKLGHETNVTFEIKNAPEELKTVSVTNTSFKDINRNQSALIIFKEGFKKDQFVLNNANEHSVVLASKESKFELLNKNEETNESIESAVYKIGLGLLLLVVFFVLLKKILSNQEESKLKNFELS